MAQSKSTRAFRTISEAGEELELQPHVLRFWESKFPQIQPIKRSGGRRFYRPEDIEFLRGIKILLHKEKHPIKDVQKLIRVRGYQSVIDLGRSVEKAARVKDIKDTDLVPKRIKPVIHRPTIIDERDSGNSVLKTSAQVVDLHPICARKEAVRAAPALNPADRTQLETALAHLQSLRTRWDQFLSENTAD